MARLHKLVVTALVAAATLPLSGCEESSFCGVPVFEFLFCDPNENSPAPAEFDRNDPPVASFGVNPAAPAVGARVTFSNTSHDPDGILPGLQGIDGADWDLDGNGSFETPGNPRWTNAGYRDDVTHTYDGAGPVSVSVRVRDWEGAEATTTRTVQVGGSSSAPTSPGTSTSAPTNPPRLQAAGTTPPHTVVGTLSFRNFSATGARRTSRSLRGALVRGRLSGSAVATAADTGVSRPRAPGALSRFLRSAVVARVDFTTNPARTRQRMAAVGLATLRGRPGGRVCFTLRLTNRAGRQPSGSLRLLGGTGAGARLFGSGRVGGELRSARTARIGGTIRTRSARSRGLPARCRGLTP